MKAFRLFTFLSATLGMLLLSACQDVLDREPQGVFSLANFFETEDHAILATNAVYNQLRNWEVHVFSYIGLTDIASDDADKGSFPADAFFLQELDDFTHNATNLAPQTVWSGYFTGVFRANLAIDGIPKVPEMDEALRQRLIGESKFLRAYFYFNLVRWFGDVPLITNPFPENFEIPRTAKADVYALIIQDLEDAAAVLPLRSQQAPADLGRVTQGSAKGLLAKVYLTLGDYPQAERYALEVINSNQYSLFPDFATLFLPEGENSSESVFEVQAAAYDQGGGGSQYSEVQGVRGSPNLGWGFNRPSDNLITSFESGDPRREATVLYVGEVLPDGSDIVADNPDIIGERYNQKSWRSLPVGGNGNGPANIKVLRYADVLLIAAEALNENGKGSLALQYLNEVRRRARGGSNVLPDVTTIDRDQLRQRIWRERRSELALEQNRWFDLARQNRLASVLQALGKNFVAGKHELWPIPQSEIDLSNKVLVQNPGYE